MQTSVADCWFPRDQRAYTEADIGRSDFDDIERIALDVRW
jgi:hypothetical protein